MVRWQRVRRVLGAVLHEVRTERVTFMAGSIAYNAFVSLLPLLLLVLAVVSTLGATTVERALLRLAEAVLTPGASDALVAELKRANETTGVSVLGAALLVWGTLRIFRSLDTAFSDIYETGTANSFSDQLLDGLVVLVTVALAVLVVAVLRTAGFDAVPGGWVVEQVITVIGLAVVLFPMYYVFPDVDDMAIREVVPGVAVAAVGLTTFQWLFGLYIAVSSRSPRESVLAGILVFLTWLYVSGLVVLLGAVINAVLTNRSADVDIDPVVGGVSPGEKRKLDRETLDASLRSLERSGTDAGEVTVTVDGTSVTLPPPDGVEAETGEGSVVPLTRMTELRLTWSEPSQTDER